MSREDLDDVREKGVVVYGSEYTRKTEFTRRDGTIGDGWEVLG